MEAEGADRILKSLRCWLLLVLLFVHVAAFDYEYELLDAQVKY